MLTTEEAAKKLFHSFYCQDGRACLCQPLFVTPELAPLAEQHLAPIRNVLFDLVYACADVADRAEQEGLESGSNAVRRVMGEQ